MPPKKLTAAQKAENLKKRREAPKKLLEQKLLLIEDFQKKIKYAPGKKVAQRNILQKLSLSDIEKFINKNHLSLPPKYINNKNNIAV